MIPTSNHNSLTSCPDSRALYIFWFLHQTTTSLLLVKTCRCCISFDSYIKPQLALKKTQNSFGCISFDSYIKPQLLDGSTDHHTVVYLLIPTSNHNLFLFIIFIFMLYIFWFLHQTTTLHVCLKFYQRCISFDSYIKPQPTGYK